MLVIIILFIAGILSAFSSFFRKKDLSKYIALAGTGIALATIVLKLQFSLHFINFYRWGEVPIIMTIVALFLAFFIILNIRDTDNQSDNASIYSLLLFSLCGAVLLFGYTNLLTLFLGIEILSIPLYVLASSQKDNRFSLEAGLKYFILGSFSSAFLLFGIALVFGTFGAFDLGTILKIQQEVGGNLPPFFHLGVLFILIAILFKMALVPFHFWAPDVYQGSPTMITAYMSTIVKVAAAMSMYYLLTTFFRVGSFAWVKYLFIIICASLIISSIMGLVQKNVKRILAYSSIAHASFILIAILITYILHNPATLSIYLIAYTIASLLSFSILNNLNPNEELNFDALNGLLKTNKIAAIGMIVAIFSMAGIPTTAGFIAKWNVLSHVYKMNPIVFVFALLSSAIGIVYYLKIINRVLFHEAKKSATYTATMASNLTIIICVILLFLLGLFPTFILDMFKSII